MSPYRDDLDYEQYHHERLPKPVNGDGPTARYLRWLAELDARVVTLPVQDELFDGKRAAG